MSGSSFFDNLGLSFAETTHQTSANSNPVIFGAIAFGRGTAGGTNSAANPSTSSDGGATAVTPVTSLGGGGGGAGDPLGNLSNVFPFIEQGMGLNGGQVQDPLAKLALYNQLPKGVKSDQLQTSEGQPVGFAPSPIAIGGILIAAAIGAFFLFRS